MQLKIEEKNTIVAELEKFVSANFPDTKNIQLEMSENMRLTVIDEFKKFAINTNESVNTNDNPDSETGDCTFSYGDKNFYINVVDNISDGTIDASAMEGEIQEPMEEETAEKGEIIEDWHEPKITEPPVPVENEKYVAGIDPYNKENRSQGGRAEASKEERKISEKTVDAPVKKAHQPEPKKAKKGKKR